MVSPSHSNNKKFASQLPPRGHLPFRPTSLDTTQLSQYNVKNTQEAWIRVPVLPPMSYVVIGTEYSNPQFPMLSSGDKPMLFGLYRLTQQHVLNTGRWFPTHSMLRYIKKEAVPDWEQQKVTCEGGWRYNKHTKRNLTHSSLGTFQRAANSPTHLSNPWRHILQCSKIIFRMQTKNAKKTSLRDLYGMRLKFHKASIIKRVTVLTNFSNLSNFHWAITLETWKTQKISNIQYLPSNILRSSRLDISKT